jgi:hypothetical protein
MTPAAQGRTVAISSAIHTVEHQRQQLVERIARAEGAGDYDEGRRLRAIDSSCVESAARYRTELAALTSQISLEV